MSVPAPTEAQIQAACLDWLALWGALAVRVNSGARPWTDRAGRRRVFKLNSQPGCSDALVCLPDGAFLAVEVKRPGKGPTDVQESFLAEVRRRNGLALVVTSVDDLRAQLKAEGYEV